MTSSEPPLLGDDGRPTSATTFLLVHRGLRNGLAALCRDAADPRRRDRLVDGWRVLRGVLDAHHEAEDERMFPSLLASMPRLAPILDQLRSQHEALVDAVDAVEQRLASGAPAAPSLASLQDLLTGHLALEEQHLVPVLAAGEPVGVPGAHHAPDPLFAAWAADGLDEPTVAVLGLAHVS